MPDVASIDNDVTENERSGFEREFNNRQDYNDDYDKGSRNLKFSAMNKERAGREYTLDEMADLQSRLMLVTGKADAGRESIERFTSVC